MFERKSSSPKSLLIFVIVLFSLIFALSLVFYSPTVKNSAPAVFLPSPQPSLTPIPSSDTDISEWKTYRNEEYGFKIKYPSLYEIKKTNEGRYAILWPSDFPARPRLFISAENNPEKKNLAAFIMSSMGDQPKTLESMTINNLSAVKVVYPEALYFAVSYYNKVISIFIDKQNGQEIAEEDKVNLEKIINTIQIIPREIIKSLETNSWSVYKSEKNKYEIKYPQSATFKERDETMDTMFLFGREAAVILRVDSKNGNIFKEEYLLTREKYEKIIVNGQEMIIGKMGGVGGGYSTFLYTEDYVYRIDLVDYTQSNDEGFAEYIKIYNEMLATFKVL